MNNDFLKYITNKPTTTKSQQPDDFQVMQSLQRILETSDLTKLTRKEVRKSLERELGGNFSSPYWKQKIKTQIEQFVREKESVIPAQQSGSSSSSHQFDNNGSNKRGRYDDDVQNDDYNPNPKRRRKIDHNDNGYNNHDNNGHNSGYPHNRRPRLQSNKQLIQKSLKDNSYYMKLPDNGGAKKRCIIHTYRRRLYVGFREYYEKDGEELPSKKVCML